MVKVGEGCFGGSALELKIFVVVVMVARKALCADAVLATRLEVVFHHHGIPESHLDMCCGSYVLW